ncbi:C-reactive protein 1.4-like [Limulus polyphemus]|uniref:C-reactive protein 1.4-like n=1 Tax=Limulus polyphemus TaxID=6850 RepID=A0ABM1BNX7_LIMPO|nr:C-reactive protein 1.4-like [Limulus polyphemus]
MASLLTKLFYMFALIAIDAYMVELIEPPENFVQKHYVQAFFPPSSGSLFPYLKLEGSLPPLRHFTLCTWAKAWNLNTNGNFIFSYSYPEKGGDNEFLVGVYKKPEAAPELSIHVRGKHSRAECSRFTIGHWHHLCYIWTRVGGRVEMSVDGQKCSNTKEIAPGLEIRTGGTAIIGQEQDSVGGGFMVEQAWNGEITDLQLWDEPLSPAQIQFIRCNRYQAEGSVFSWMKSPMVAHGVVFSETNVCKLSYPFS